MGAHVQLLAGVGARARAQHQVEDILGVDGQAADLRAGDLQRPRDVAGFAAVAEQGERAQRGGCEGDGVPFQHDGGLRRVAAAEDGGRGGVEAVGGGDGGLEVVEGGLGGGFGGVVARDGDVNDAAGGDGGREQDGGKFDLEGRISFGGSCEGLGGIACESFVFGEENGDTGVDLADSEGDQHRVITLRLCVVRFATESGKCQVEELAEASSE